MSGKGSWRLTVEESFSASHCLRNYGGKCERMHGHNFSVRAVVAGKDLDPASEILMDFKELRAELKAALEPLDHRHLNDTPPFDELNPSSENMARHIFQVLAGRLSGRGLRVAEVEVSEKPGQSASYSEEPAP